MEINNIITELNQKDPVVIKSVNSKDKMECIKYLMSFYHIFKHHFKDLDEIIVFDKWIDLKLVPLQISVSTITMFANDNNIDSAIKFYKEQINE